MYKKSIYNFTILITIISIIPISTCINYFQDSEIQESRIILYNQDEFQYLKTNALYEVSSIVIDDNDPTRNWSVFASAMYPWFSGAGTKNNPYVIQDVAVTSGYITIMNSEVYFRIENCEARIQFYDIIHGKLVNCNCSNSPLLYGIELRNSNESIISGNVVIRNYLGGLYLENSHNNTIFGNTLMEYGWWINGITLANSNYNLVESNTASFNSYAGIGVYGNNNTIIDNYVERNTYGIRVNGLNNTIMGNTAFNNSNSGIYIHDRSYNNITGNILDLNGLYGIYLEDTSHIIVDDNIGYNNGKAGILFEDVNKIKVLRNSMYGCGYFFAAMTSSSLSSLEIDTSNLVNDKPFYYYVDQKSLKPIDFNNAGQVFLFNCSDSLISTIDVSNGTLGIWLINSINNTIESVISSYNLLSGIFMSNSNNNTAIGCTTTYNENNGILLQNSHNCIITGTETNYNKANGITLDKSHNNTISDNTANYNNIRGIRVYFSNENLISGNTLDYNQIMGISIEGGDTGWGISYCLNNTIFGNSVHENGDYGIYLVYGMYHFVKENIAQLHHTQENGGYSVDQYGILLEHCYFCNVSENEVAENEVGIVLSGSANNLLYKNHLVADLSANILLSWSSNNTLLENFIESDTPWAGIEFDHSHYNIIEKNEVVHGGTALWLQESDYNVIIENYFHDLTATAVVLSESSYNLISNNTIRNCYRCFSEGDNCIGNVFENNICEGEGYHPSIVTGYNSFIILIIMILLVSLISLTRTSINKKIRN